MLVSQDVVEFDDDRFDQQIGETEQSGGHEQADQSEGTTEENGKKADDDTEK